MYFYCPGNYRWSYAVHLALRTGCQIGEIDRHLGAMRNDPGVTEEQWAKGWSAAAEEQQQLAEDDLGRGYEISAGERLLRASIFHINAERQLPPSQEKEESYARSLETFSRGAELARLPFERVEIGSPDGVLPGIFISSGRDEPAPTMIFFDGFDITKEIMALTVRDAFRRRGHNCITIDSPGVGEPLRLRGVPSRYDYEVPAGAAIDYLETRPDVDADRIGVMGVSLGGYYAPRAAAFEPRIKACVAWGAILDYGATWVERLKTQTKTTSVPYFQLPWVMGADSFDEAMDKVRRFDLTEALPRITQPTLILHGEHDKQIPLADAQHAFELVGSPDKELRVFSEAEGGAEHCQTDEPAAALQLIADWAKQKLGGVG